MQGAVPSAYSRFSMSRISRGASSSASSVSRATAIPRPFASLSNRCKLKLTGAKSRPSGAAFASVSMASVSVRQSGAMLSSSAANVGVIMSKPYTNTFCPLNTLEASNRAHISRDISSASANSPAIRCS